jgi:hypothetical protein
METTTLIIGQETMEVLPESFQEMYDTVQSELEWGDLVFVDSEGNFASAETPLEGRTCRVKEVMHRVKCATVQFPGESARVTIYKDTGAEIKKWIENEVQAKCKVMVISRKLEPCPEEVDPDEIYDDVQFRRTPLEPLSDVQPRDHTFTRHPSYVRKREDRAWTAFMQEIQELEIRYFGDAMTGENEEVKKYWHRIQARCDQVQKSWVEAELPKIRAEEIDPNKCCTQV